jgi:Amt family ammonium transporter
MIRRAFPSLSRASSLAGLAALALGFLSSFLSAAPAGAAETAPEPKPPTLEQKVDAAFGSAVETTDKGQVKNGALFNDVNTLWTCLAAFLVFFMQAGFAMVETGFTRAKNACNILMKNLLDFCFGSIAFWAVGFGLMFGMAANWGVDYYLFNGCKMVDGKPVENGFNWAFWLFQVVFCATAATIVSGAMAERTKFAAYIVYSIFISAVVYPIFGSWAWQSLWIGNKGWLEAPDGGFLAAKGLPGFIDFAGSTVVHSMGGWAALAGVIVLGNRRGRYDEGGVPGGPIPGHNIPLAVLGVFILWLGWFGFNPGSTTAVGGGSFAKIVVVTNLAACAGAISAMSVTWMATGKPDIGMTLNGTLAGLVAITAGCNNVNPGGALLIGAVAGVLVYYSVLCFDAMRLDDPVGAVSVHGVCGLFGTLACGLPFLDNRTDPETGKAIGSWAQFATQCIGAASAFVLSFGVMSVFFLLLKVTIGLRVSPEEETEGLDIGEHGYMAYANFNEEA